MFDTKHFHGFVRNGSACFPSNNRLKVLGTGTAAPSFSKDGWSGLHGERLGTKIIVKILWLTAKYLDKRINTHITKVNQMQVGSFPARKYSNYYRNGKKAKEYDNVPG